MKAQILQIYVDNQVIDPSLCIQIQVEYCFEYESPLSLKGKIKCNDHKVVSVFNHSFPVHTEAYSMYFLQQDKKNHSYQQNKLQKQFTVIAQLTREALTHIELQRSKDSTKSVNFVLDLFITAIELSATQTNPPNNSLKVTTNTNLLNYQIEQGKWIRDFVPQLGIGRFLLLELPVFENKSVPEFWQELYTKLAKNLSDMEKHIQAGEWDNVMVDARRFFENIKIGDTKTGNKKFKIEFDKILTHESHDTGGISDFYDIIWKTFEFTSKYIHEIDKHGNHKATPITCKEDAYMVYTMAIGILNFFGTKLSKHI